MSHFQLPQNWGHLDSNTSWLVFSGSFRVNFLSYIRQIFFFQVYFFWNVSVNKTGCNLSENLAELSSFWLWSLRSLWWTDIDYRTNRPTGSFTALSDCILVPLYCVENTLQITLSWKKEPAQIYSVGLLIRPNRTRAIKYYITWILLYQLCLLAVTLNLGKQTLSHETFLSRGPARTASLEEMISEHQRRSVRSCDLSKNDDEMMTMMHFSFKEVYIKHVEPQKGEASFSKWANCLF